jgi:hypothetical protein
LGRLRLSPSLGPSGGESGAGAEQGVRVQNAGCLHAAPGGHYVGRLLEFLAEERLEGRAKRYGFVDRGI